MPSSTALSAFLESSEQWDTQRWPERMARAGELLQAHPSDPLPPFRLLFPARVSDPDFEFSPAEHAQWLDLAHKFEVPTSVWEDLPSLEAWHEQSCWARALAHPTLAALLMKRLGPAAAFWASLDQPPEGWPIRAALDVWTALSREQVPQVLETFVKAQGGALPQVCSQGLVAHWVEWDAHEAVALALAAGFDPRSLGPAARALELALEHDAWFTAIELINHDPSLASDTLPNGGTRYVEVLEYLSSDHGMQQFFYPPLQRALSAMRAFRRQGHLIEQLDPSQAACRPRL
jgi:hypothetical protein